ncbi:MAG: ferritin family protein [Armatimonadota bacterium]
MPQFLDPFSGIVPRKMTTGELVRALRQNIAAEHEATHLYMAHADATDDEVAKKVLIDIANEERVHVGEFMELLRRLAPDETQYLEDGRLEVTAMAEGVAGGEPAAAGPPANEMTIGNLREDQG